MFKYLQLLFVLFTLCSCQAYAQQSTGATTDANIRILGNQDTLTLRIITIDPRTQLSFLMQGIHIVLRDTSMNYIASLDFPNASMVRDKIHHHPNEVKAMHGQNGNEVRPDLLPLISALNDTCSVARDGVGDYISCKHLISLDKSTGNMTFEIGLLVSCNKYPGDMVFVEVLSTPTVLNTEFSGRMLSQENQMPPGGMGQAVANVHDNRRNIRINNKIHVEDTHHPKHDNFDE